MAELIIGIDEVGMGCLAGPVVVAGVVLPEDAEIKGVRDSKKVQPHRRADLDSIIKEQALHWVIARSSAEQIDKSGIATCQMRLMAICAQRCLDRYPDAMVIVDGNKPILELSSSQQRVIPGADDIYQGASAASIIAKLYRDRYMWAVATEFPLYDMHKNSGYGTKVHMTQLRKHGPCPEHRRSFKPVAEAERRKVRRDGGDGS